jgi:hypothetical protein
MAGMRMALEQLRTSMDLSPYQHTLVVCSLRYGSVCCVSLLVVRFSASLYGGLLVYTGVIRGSAMP